MAGRVTPHTSSGQPIVTVGYLEALWINAGGPANVAPIAAAIAMAESSGINREQIGGGTSVPLSQTGWGYWQITPGSSALLNPQANAAAAVAKYKNAPGGGNNFSPWTTYRDGTYKKFLPHGSLAGDILGGTLLAGLGGAFAPGLVAALGGGAAATAEAESATAGAEGASGAATGAATGTASGGLAGALKGLSSLASIKSGLGAAALIAALLDPKHLLRMLMVIGGLILILVALIYMVKAQALKKG